MSLDGEVHHFPGTDWKDGMCRWPRFPQRGSGKGQNQFHHHRELSGARSYHWLYFLSIRKHFGVLKNVLSRLQLGEESPFDWRNINTFKIERLSYHHNWSFIVRVWKLKGRSCEWKHVNKKTKHISLSFQVYVRFLKVILFYFLILTVKILLNCFYIPLPWEWSDSCWES